MLDGDGGQGIDLNYNSNSIDCAHLLKIIDFVDGSETEAAILYGAVVVTDNDL